MSTTIFLSYARGDDEAFVTRLYEDLTARGFDVWWDRVTMPARGLTFLHEIRDAINARERLLLVIGPKATISDYVVAEWQHAVTCDKPINPVLRLGEYQLVPDELKLLHVEDFRDDSRYALHLENLVRQLSEPIAPMGKLVGVPSLPRHLLTRPEHLQSLKRALLANIQRPVVVTGVAARIGVHGMGGIGKSVLANLLVRDSDVRRAFPDGIIWVPFGTEPNLVELQRNVAKVFADPDYFENFAQGRTKLAELLASKAVLLVLDDVWELAHAEAFNVLGPRCRTVITTRDAGLVTILSGTQHQIQLLTESESFNLLAGAAGVNAYELPQEAHEIVSECGRLALAVALCAGMVKRGVTWISILQRLKQAALETIGDRNAENAHHFNLWMAMKVSVDALTPDEQRRFIELSVLPNDETVPEAAVRTLWSHTGGLSEFACEDLLISLSERSLLRLDTQTHQAGRVAHRRVSLHDLLHDFATKLADDLTSLHNQLLGAYGKSCPYGWESGPDDGYFFQHLPRHLRFGGRLKQLTELLISYAWIENKLVAAGVNAVVRDYELAVVDELCLVRDAVRLAAHVVSQDPHQLASQLVGRLLRLAMENHPTVRQLLENIYLNVGHPWLRPLAASLSPPGTSLLRVLNGHKYRVNSVAATPDGQRAISASDDETLKVWDLALGEEIHTLRGHIYAVQKVVVSSDGRYAASSSQDLVVHPSGMNPDDCTIKIWDLERGNELHTLRGHMSQVRGIAIAGNEKRLVSGSRDGTLKLWDLECGVELHTFPEHSGGVSAVAASADGRRAISAFGNTLKVWDLASLQELWEVVTQGESITAVASNADGSRVIAGLNDGTLKVWDVGKCEEFRTLRSYSPVSAIVLSADGHRAASAHGYDTRLHVWDLESSASIAELAGHTDLTRAVAANADCNIIVSGSNDRTSRVWDLRRSGVVAIAEAHESFVRRVAVSADGRRAFSSSDDHSLKVWDLERGCELRTLLGHTGPVWAMATSANGSRAVSYSPQEMIRIWDLESGLPLHTLFDSFFEGAVALSDDGKLAVWGMRTGAINVFDIEHGREMHRLVGHTEPVMDISISGDGNWAVSAGFDHTLRVWDVKNGRQLHTIRRNISPHLKISADGRLAISGADDGSVQVWDVLRGREMHSLHGHGSALCALALSRDGRKAVSSAYEGTVKVWDVEQGNESTRLRGRVSVPDKVAIAKDGKSALFGSWDHSLKLWQLETGDLIASFTAEGHPTCCALSDDGRTIVAGGRMGAIDILRLECGRMNKR